MRHRGHVAGAHHTHVRPPETQKPLEVEAHRKFGGQQVSADSLGTLGVMEVPTDGGGLRGGDPAPHSPAFIRPLPFFPFGLCYLLDFVFLFIGMKRSHN